MHFTVDILCSKRFLQGKWACSLWNTDFVEQLLSETEQIQSRTGLLNSISVSVTSVIIRSSLFFPLQNTMKSTKHRHSRGDSGTRPASKWVLKPDSCSQNIKTGFYNKLLRSWSTSKQPVIFNSGPLVKFTFLDQRTPPNKQHKAIWATSIVNLSKSSTFQKGSFFTRAHFLLEQSKWELLPDHPFHNKICDMHRPSQDVPVVLLTLF